MRRFDCSPITLADSVALSGSWPAWVKRRMLVPRHGGSVWPGSRPHRLSFWLPTRSCAVHRGRQQRVSFWRRPPNVERSSSKEKPPMGNALPRSVSEYSRVLEARPEMLRSIEASADLQEANREPRLQRELQAQTIIRVWDEIPDVMAMAVPQTEWLVQGIIPQGS